MVVLQLYFWLDREEGGQSIFVMADVAAVLTIHVTCSQSRVSQDAVL